LAVADKVVVLRDGQVEQIGTPDELWNFPANSFVAEFLSNAITASAMVAAEKSVVLAQKLACSINKECAVGKEVKLALRKDNFVISEQGIEGRIVFCEYNGGVYQMRVEVQDGLIIPVSSTRELPIGALISVDFNRETEISVVGI